MFSSFFFFSNFDRYCLNSSKLTAKYSFLIRVERNRKSIAIGTKVKSLWTFPIFLSTRLFVRLKVGVSILSSIFQHNSQLDSGTICSTNSILVGARARKFQNSDAIDQLNSICPEDTDSNTKLSITFLQFFLRISKFQP